MPDYNVRMLVVVMGLASTSALAAPPVIYGEVVGPGGTLLSGNAVRVQKNPDLEGTYYVYFKSAVTGCVSQVSVTGTGTTPVEAAAIATVGPASGTPSAIAVQIRDGNGALVPRGFQLTTTCFR